MNANVRFAACLVGLGFLATFGAGCSNQGIGERCDTKNGSGDCESGLVCTEVSNRSYCCPPVQDPNNPPPAQCTGGATRSDAGAGGSTTVTDASAADASGPDVANLDASEAATGDADALAPVEDATIDAPEDALEGG